MQEDAILVFEDSHAESGSAKELAELKAMLRRQDAEMERLRTQLAATEIEKRKETEIPDLNMAGNRGIFEEGESYGVDEGCIVTTKPTRILHIRQLLVNSMSRAFNLLVLVHCVVATPCA